MNEAATIFPLRGTSRRGLLILLAVGAALALGGCTGAEDTVGGEPKDSRVVEGPDVASNAPGAPNAPEPHGNAPQDGAPAAAAKPVQVVMETSMGTIELELYPDKAPVTVKNFVSYAKKGHYNGTIFHRVISDFMIQGGGMTADMKEKPTDPPIVNEAKNGLHNERGTIAMARTSDPNSATSQFFINVEDNSTKLDPEATPDGVGYAVFGKVTRGMDVVDKIRNVPTTHRAGHDDVPETPVTIRSVKVKES